MNNQCFFASDDQVIAIMNWYLRKDEFDVMILDPLDTQDMATYTKLSGPRKCGELNSSDHIRGRWAASLRTDL